MTTQLDKPMVGQKVICNGYEGVISRVLDGQLSGMVEVRLDRGVVCVPYAFPDCYPIGEVKRHA
jgi:hypothetical protein